MQNHYCNNNNNYYYYYGGSMSTSGNQLKILKILKWSMLNLAMRWMQRKFEHLINNLAQDLESSGYYLGQTSASVLQHLCYALLLVFLPSTSIIMLI